MVATEMTVVLNVEPRSECHCGTSLGSIEAPTPHVAREREIARKRKAGWSRARIDRWLQQKQAATTRRESDHAQHVRSVRADDTIDGWLPFVRGVLRSCVTRELGLVVTWGEYSGHPDDEEIVRLADLSPTTLLTMRKNVVYRGVQ